MFSRGPVAHVAAFRARHWLALAVALYVLNAALTFHNVWPTPWIALRREFSIDVAVLVLALAVASAFARPPGRLVSSGLTLLLLAFAIGRYAEVTSPALYGRPVNLYWDAQHLLNVAAMFAAVAPWWLAVLLVVGVVALLGVLAVALAWCLGRVAHALRHRAPRLVLGVLAFGVVSHYAASRALDWPSRFRYSVPVSATYAQQIGFVLAARATASNRVLPIVPLPRSTFSRLAGDDVLLVFLESYGAATYDLPAVARAVTPAREELVHAAEETEHHVVSAFVAAPTFGGGSWLSHASFMSGHEVRDPGDYALLLTQQRDTLPKLFRQAGYRAMAVMPGTRNAWPEGAFYGFDTLYGAWDLDYRGPDFGWWRIPDQFSLASVAAMAARSEPRAPLFTFLPTINTHVPFVPLPPYQPDWRRLFDAEPFAAAAVAASLDVEPDWDALGEPYAESFVYTFTYLAGYLRERAAAGGELLLLVGDHQPIASVTGPGARWDVPAHVVTQRADLAAELVAAGFVDGVKLAAGQPPIATLPELLTLLLSVLDDNGT